MRALQAEKLNLRLLEANSVCELGNNTAIKEGTKGLILTEALWPQSITVLKHMLNFKHVSSITEFKH